MDVVTLGMSIGMANALLAVGIVLIHRANRVINMAHGEFGAFCVAMVLALTRYHHLNYWVALVASLAATGALAAAVERTIIARLWQSPRLILLIATVGVAQLVAVIRLVLPKPRTGSGDAILVGGAGSFPLPFDSPTVVWDRVVLGPGHFLSLVVGPLLVVGLAAFLRWSPYGVALRAAAENAARARLLGIPVRRLSTMAWVISAVFAGVASVLLAPIIGFSATEAVGLPILMRGLAAATIARMESVGTAFGVGLALGVADQLVFFWTGRSGLTDLVLLAVIVVVLLAQRAGSGRTLAWEASSWEMSEPVRPLPDEIAQHPTWRLVTGVAAAAAAAAVITAPMRLSFSATALSASVFLIAAVVVSLTVLTGWAGQLSLGAWAIAGVGGVLGARLVADHHVPFLLAFVLAAAAGGVTALLLGLPALRLEGTGLAVVTLGFAVTAGSWLFTQPWFEAEGFFEPPDVLTTDVLYWVTLGYLALTVVAVRRLQRSRVGRNIVASRDNPRHAASFGVDVTRAKLVAFVLSGVLSAGSGFLWATLLESSSGNLFPPIRSLSMVSAAVIGGLSTVGGAVAGAAWIYGIPYFGAGLTQYIGLLATGGGLLVLLLFFPGGLARMSGRLRDLAARRITGIDPRPDVVPVSVTETLGAARVGADAP